MSTKPTLLSEHPSQSAAEQAQHLPGERWVPVLQQQCDFGPSIFCDVSLNLIRNPNITSSHLFRADILSDSQNEDLRDVDIQAEDIEHARTVLESLPSLDQFSQTRTLVRKLIPRNPQLDRPIAQTCRLLGYTDKDGAQHNISVLEPHVNGIEDLPWYHPAVRSVAYWHSWKPESKLELRNTNGEPDASGPRGMITLYYQLFPDQDAELSSRLNRTALNLLTVLCKHGQGSLAGYTKKVHHDQIISQQRVQNTYTELKTKYAKGLCDKWVEQTEPSKHVFEDLGIAAFLIELWRDMYALPTGLDSSTNILPAFPGFVDIGCGNGVLTEILLQEGYKGRGFDARRRKTWSILSPKAQACLSETLFVPQPLFDLYPPSSTPESPSTHSIIAKARSLFTSSSPTSSPTSSLTPPRKNWHNGLFPRGTFVISNHADELTPWTPLIAYLTESPFLAIPCCSHNLSGDRFRAPSAYNSYTADANSPSYFAANKPKTRAKSVAITIPCMDETGQDDDDGTCAHAAFAPSSSAVGDLAEDPSADPSLSPSEKIEGESSGQPATTTLPVRKAETGDLKKLSPQARAKQPSAYAALCDWVTHLSSEVGFEIEREMLRIPSTRNVGLVGRGWREGFKTHTQEERNERVMGIINREGADGKKFVARCEGVLAKDGGREGVHAH